MKHTAIYIDRQIASTGIIILCELLSDYDGLMGCGKNGLDLSDVHHEAQRFINPHEQLLESETL